MKIKFLRLAALPFATLAALSAAPLSVTTAVHTRPDSSSPAITFLKAGTEPMAAAGAEATTPNGWMAVELPGPFEGYVENKDLSKSLDVKPGAAIRVAPKADAGMLVAAEKGDKVNITGLRGKWTQISLEKNLVGYIKIGGAPAPVPPAAAASTAPRASSPSSGSPGSAPAPTAVHGTATAGHAVPMINQGDGGASTLPRQFAGRFVSTRRPFTPRRPYDYALNDEAGRRYAYVDISKLLLTEQIEKYIDHLVVVFGAANTVPDTKDIVIKVETLQLK